MTAKPVSKKGAGENRNVANAEKLIGDSIGQLMDFWGFRKNLGRIWSLLYLESEPLSAAEIGERLMLATGTVSMSLNELLRWGAIRKVYREGERKDFFEPETDLWRLITGVLKNRERRLLDETANALEQAREAVQPLAAKDPEYAFKLQRILLLAQLTQVATMLFDQLVNEQSIEVSPFLKLMKPGK